MPLDTLTNNAPVHILLLSGSMGSGKTTVLGEASDILLDEGVPHATLDLDAMAAVLVSEETADDLNLRNLAGVYRNFVDAGLTRILLAEAVETRNELDRLREVLWGARLLVCRLTATLDTMERRLRLREPGLHQDRFVLRSRTLQETLEAAKLEDFIVINDGRTITDVAREVLQRAGWIG